MAHKASVIPQPVPVLCAPRLVCVPAGSAPTWAVMQQPAPTSGVSPLRDRPGAGARTSLSVLRSNADVERTANTNFLSFQVGRVPARLTVLGLPSGVGTGSRPYGIGGPSTVSALTNRIVAPPQGIAELRRKENQVSHRSVVSTPLVGRIEHTRDRWRVITSDGVVDADEQREISRELALMEPEAQLVQRSLRFVSIAIQGAGVDGGWFDRNWREDREDRLRLVVDNTDGPEPGGPGAAQPVRKRKAA